MPVLIIIILVAVSIYLYYRAVNSGVKREMDNLSNHVSRSIEQTTPSRTVQTNADPEQTLINFFKRQYILIHGSFVGLIPDSVMKFEILNFMQFLYLSLSPTFHKSIVLVNDSFVKYVDQCFPSDSHNFSICFGDRDDLYFGVMRDEIVPLGQWRIVDPSPELAKEHLFMIFTVMGDLIWNPSCADCYESSPFLLKGFTESVEFDSAFMKAYYYVQQSVREFSKLEV